MANILVVEDERAINHLICKNLSLVGHHCKQVYDGNSARKEITEAEWDIVILDVMIPGISGFDLMKQIKGIPVILVTALDGIQDKIRGLTSGAEDYLVKPFEMQELIARVEIILRRFHKNDSFFCLDDVNVSFESRMVEKGGIEIQMTPKEFELLEILIRNRNIALSRERILDLAWGYDFEGDTRTVDVHIQKLRKKLDWENRIKTVYKTGYRLEVREI